MSGAILKLLCQYYTLPDALYSASLSKILLMTIVLIIWPEFAMEAPLERQDTKPGKSSDLFKIILYILVSFVAVLAIILGTLCLFFCLCKKKAKTEVQKRKKRKTKKRSPEAVAPEGNEMIVEKKAKKDDIKFKDAVEQILKNSPARRKEEQVVQVVEEEEPKAKSTYSAFQKAKELKDKSAGRRPDAQNTTADDEEEDSGTNDRTRDRKKSPKRVKPKRPAVEASALQGSALQGSAVEAKVPEQQSNSEYSRRVVEMQNLMKDQKTNKPKERTGYNEEDDKQSVAVQAMTTTNISNVDAKVDKLMEGFDDK